MYKEPVHLILVSSKANSNKFYRMKQISPDSFVIEYGRVGMNPRTSEHDMWCWDEKYREKLRKGYEDHSHMYTVVDAKKEKIQKEYLPVSNEGIRKFIDKLLESAAKVLSSNYRISDGLVTQEMIDSANSQIRQLAASRSSLDNFNESLEKLFMIIPRKMDRVEKFLAKENSDFDKIMEREQDLLDVMATKVKTNVILEEDEDLDNPTIQKDILEAMGLIVTEIDEKEELHIKKMMGRMSSNYLRAYRIENPKTRTTFRDYHAKVGKEKKIMQLWHGSRTENWWSILNNGLVLRPNAVITGKMFGYGLYFANRALKASGYVSARGSRWANGDANSGFMAIYDVLYGTPFIMDQRWHSSYGQLTYKKLREIQSDADCLHAIKEKSGLLNDEIVVYKAEQCTIKYLVEVSA